MSEFAKRTRYYNLACLSGGTATQMREPIEAWWAEIGTPILEQHYNDKQQAKDAVQGKIMSALLSPHTHVIQHDEASQTISNI